MKSYYLDPDYVSKCLQANRHNNATTTYYLSLKKFISDGGQTSCDLSSKSFDKSILEPNKRKKENAVIDNFLTKNIDNLAVLRRKSKDKSREKLNRENK